MRPFQPLFRNPHLATLAGNFWPRPVSVDRWPVQDVIYEPEPGIGILVRSQTPETPKGEVVLVHGLEGSSESGYALSMSHALLYAGYTVHRYNMRGCGGSPWHPKGNYHSGQTGDLLHVAEKLRDRSALPLYVTGFSLGGNVILKLAGELGERAQSIFAGVCSVSAPIDLAASVKQTSATSNFLYERRFVERLKKRVVKRHTLAPELFPLEHLPRVKTIEDFDDFYTSKIFGFGNAANYYKTQSSNQFLERIRVPTLLVQAKDDPMIPFSCYGHPAIAANPYLELLAVDHGGHLGFLARGARRFWLDDLVVDWLQSSMNQAQNKTARANVL